MCGYVDAPFNGDLMKRLISAVVFGCVALPASAAAQEPAKLPPTKIIDTAMNAVVVQNDRNAAVTVYLETGNLDRRLGTVAAHGTKSLALPAWVVNSRASVRFFAHAEDAPGNLATPQITLRPPGRIGMRIPTVASLGTPAAPNVMMATIAPEDQDHATLTVDNPRDVPCVVFAEAGVSSVKLGVAQPGERVTLRLPKAVINPFNPVLIYVRPQGGFDFRSPAVSIRPGQHLGVRVPAF
jgi:hypothetical protein